MFEQIQKSGFLKVKHNGRAASQSYVLQQLGQIEETDTTRLLEHWMALQLQYYNKLESALKGASQQSRARTQPQSPMTPRAPAGPDIPTRARIPLPMLGFEQWARPKQLVVMTVAEILDDAARPVSQQKRYECQVRERCAGRYKKSLTPEVELTAAGWNSAIKTVYPELHKKYSDERDPSIRNPTMILVQEHFDTDSVLRLIFQTVGKRTKRWRIDPVYVSGH